MLEHLELGERGQAAPVHDRDRRPLARATAMGAQHGRELPSSSRHDAHAETLAEPPHDREGCEDLRELVVIGHARRGLRVVLDEPDHTVLADEAIEARGRRGGREARIGECEGLFARIEIELTPKIFVLEECLFEAAESRVDHLGGGVHLRVLPLADEIRSKRDAERPLAEYEAALALTLGEHRRALLREYAVLEQLVVGDERRQRRASLIRYRTCRHHRCSPFHGGVASPVAYEMTRSLIFSSTHAKLSSLIEKLSKSGAGFRKSIA